ncbi:DUF4274 domain-containing protein [Paenibacillus sp. AR247]|uniref:DUF4274 domain-containing protein n=1 Tax=Paenibacillus sp. AR247 TaxID=1631599 RepID=UPI002157E919|nr:DUF4274 domain-containing protein [Paenibacillus sp. AR247]
MIAALENPECAEITMLDMYELLDADYWLGMDEADAAASEEGRKWRRLAESLKEKVGAKLI